MQRFLMVGLLGSFTTFSSFSLQTVQLFENGQGAHGTLSVLGSVLSCLLAGLARCESRADGDRVREDGSEIILDFCGRLLHL
ncbi:MAG: putative fluoride ion transporter CrcB [Verrucomicrobia subdivision 3 bacterium]|nr:putative fluoride ion transporter CrcB [Limisphaerales bacterium]MCS1412893.1 putative fluoride ion transporter CrcB [Limisphaerales bacterium]